MSTRDDIKAVQTVLDTFGPVMTALPATLDALIMQDKAERRLKQLEDDANKLVDRYNAQVAVWEQAEADHKARMDAQSMAHTEQVNKAQVVLKEVQRKVREAGKTLEEKEKALMTAQTVMEAELAKEEFEGAARIEAARKATDAQVAIIETEVEAANKRYAAAAKKLEDLKAKL